MGKRGPKRQSGKRAPSGRLLQGKTAVSDRRQAGFDKEQQKTMKTALTARQNIHGLSETESIDPRAGSLIGRMRQTNEISESQYQAAIRWIKDLEAYHKALESPRDAMAVNLEAIGGRPVTSDQEHEQWALKAKQRHEDALDAICAHKIKHHSRYNPPLVIDMFLVKEKRLISGERSLKLILNCLSDHYGFDRVSG